MSDPLRFVPPRVQLVDPRTGLISREWYLFFQGVFIRVGGADGVGTSELEASLFEDAGSSETNAMVFDLSQASGQQNTQPLFDAQTDTSQDPYVLESQVDNLCSELSALQDRVAELVKEIDSIKQSTLI